MDSKKTFQSFPTLLQKIPSTLLSQRAEFLDNSHSFRIWMDEIKDRNQISSRYIVFEAFFKWNISWICLHTYFCSLSLAEVLGCKTFHFAWKASCTTWLICDYKFISFDPLKYTGDGFSGEKFSHASFITVFNATYFHNFIWINHVWFANCSQSFAGENWWFREQRKNVWSSHFSRGLSAKRWRFNGILSVW